MCRLSQNLEPVLNLLLFLSALLAGFTGAISGGQRADAPAVQQSVAQMRDSFAETVAQLPAPAPRRMATVRSPIVSELIVQPSWALQIVLPVFEIGRVNEKRLV